MKIIFKLIIAFLAIYLGISIAIIVTGVALGENYIKYKFIFEDSLKPSLFIIAVILFFSYLIAPKK